jgi:hypothetical protein
MQGKERALRLLTEIFADRKRHGNSNFERTGTELFLGGFSPQDAAGICYRAAQFVHAAVGDGNQTLCGILTARETTRVTFHCLDTELIGINTSTDSKRCHVIRLLDLVRVTLQYQNVDISLSYFLHSAKPYFEGNYMKIREVNAA